VNRNHRRRNRGICRILMKPQPQLEGVEELGGQVRKEGVFEQTLVRYRSERGWTFRNQGLNSGLLFLCRLRLALLDLVRSIVQTHFQFGKGY
jgi:hypothetical protein